MPHRSLCPSGPPSLAPHGCARIPHAPWVSLRFLTVTPASPEAEHVPPRGSARLPTPPVRPRSSQVHAGHREVFKLIKKTPDLDTAQSFPACTRAFLTKAGFSSGLFHGGGFINQMLMREARFRQLLVSLCTVSTRIRSAVAHSCQHILSPMFVKERTAERTSPGSSSGCDKRSHSGTRRGPSPSAGSESAAQSASAPQSAAL